MGFFQKVSKSTTGTMLKRKLSRITTPDEAAPKTVRAEPLISPPPDESIYFTNSNPTFAQKFLNIQLVLNSALKPLEFKPPVAYIYNPVEYAFEPNKTYVTKYCQGAKKLLFVGMNPGPFGMCQTGVPFGEIKIVRDWLKIEEQVDKPAKECPQRPVLGFACTRSEVSGDRLWNVIKKISGTPEVFLKNCFVYNYCPLALLKSDGGNLTPSDIKDAQLLEEICDRFFFRVIELLDPEVIVGIGRYAEKRTLLTLKDNNSTRKVLCLTHPSPRVKNNQNWAEKAEEFFKNEDLIKYMK